VLAGGSGADTLLGGPGDDLVWATDFERNSTDVLDPAFLAAPGDNVIDCGEGNDMVVVDLADDRGMVVNCEYRIVLRSVRSDCSPVSRWLHGGRLKPSSLLDLSRYPANANRVLDSASPFAEKPARPTDEASMLSCSDYAARYVTDPTDDLRPNVRGTIGDDVLLAVPAGQVADIRSAMLGGSPDGASVFNACEGNDVVTGSPGADTVLGGDGEDRIDGGAATTSASKARPATISSGVAPATTCCSGAAATTCSGGRTAPTTSRADAVRTRSRAAAGTTASTAGWAPTACAEAPATTRSSRTTGPPTSSTAAPATTSPTSTVTTR
jgi:hypothetical protein